MGPILWPSRLAGDLGDEMLAPGTYVAVLMSDDGSAVLAQQPFTVTD